MTTTTAAIAYVRVSTEQQATEGVSMAAQLERIRAYCLANGLELVAIHEDAGLSGKRADNRPGLQAALTDVCNRGGVLVVYSLSRLARSVSDSLAIIDRLQRAGADLASLTERIDTTSAAGKMLLTMLAAFAQFERDLTAERTTAALAHKKSLGQRVGTVPFGWDLATDGITLLENAAEQQTIATIRALRASGMTLQAIADRLNASATPTKKGTKWVHKTIRDIANRAA
jgi:DNA invertase Pin-like site-specific DNA recombinase